MTPTRFAAAASLAIGAAFAAAPVAAQEAAATAEVVAPEVTLSAGDVVMGNDQTQLGTIAAIDGDVVVVDTGKHKVPLAKGAFGLLNEQLAVNISKSEIDATMDARVAEQEAKLAAALIVGADVISVDGLPVGTIAMIEGADFVIESEAKRFALRRENFGIGPEGRLMVLASHADLMAALGG